MIKEIAITPGVFEQSGQANLEDWRDALLLLIQFFGPSETPKPIVISNLCNDSWYQFVGRNVTRIVDRKAKERCMQFLQVIDSYLVKRRSYSGDELMEDFTWFQEALLASRDERIDCILTSDNTKGQSNDSLTYTIGVGDVAGTPNVFDHGDDSSPPLDIKQQIENLGKVLYYADWLKLISPYGLSTEKAFTIQLIEAFAARGSGKEKDVSIYIKHASQSIQGHTSAADSIESTVKTLRRKWKHLKDKVQVRLFFEPVRLDRYLLAGTYTISRKEKLRWPIFLGHIAREYSEERTEWKLLSRSRASEFAKKFTNLHLQQPMASSAQVEPIEVL